MSIEMLVFLIALFATFFNNGLQWYTQVTTYPLFAWVGQAEFVSFHKAYERRLPLAIYGPYALLMLCNLALLFVRPALVNLALVWVLLLLNASIMVVSLAFAAPVHARLDQAGQQDAQSIRQLLTFNAVRLIASTISSIVMAYLLVRVLAG